MGEEEKKKELVAPAAEVMKIDLVITKMDASIHHLKVLLQQLN